MLYTITRIEDSITRQLIVDTDNKTIRTNSNSDIYPVMRLTTNNNDVVRINKTSISYYNFEMLTYILTTNKSAFNAVYGRIYGIIPGVVTFK